jgi:hypothetical protein
MSATGWTAICFLLGVALSQNFTGANAAEQAWSVEASAGLQYDSNVVIEETDVVSDEGDGATIIDLELDYEVNLNPDTSLELGYNFGLAKYFKFTNFDRQIHSLTATLRREFGAMNAGASYGLYHARLDGDGFLTLHRASPYISFLPNAETYLWFAYAYSAYDLIGRSARDANAHQAYADVYYFLNGNDRYLRAGYEYEIRDANDRQFSFNGNSLKADFVTAVPLGERNATFRAGYVFERRDYKGITPSIGEKRDDSRHTLTSEFEFELSDRWLMVLEYRYRDAASNLRVADYEEQRIEWRIGLVL